MIENIQEQFQVTRRDGTMVPFSVPRIRAAIAKAYLRDADGVPRHSSGDGLLQHEKAKIDRLTDQVVTAVTRRQDAADYPIHLEDIQDQVELALMREGDHQVARDYVLYREGRRLARDSVPRMPMASSHREVRQ